MNKLIALCYFVLSLYGCDVGGNTLVYRTQANGADMVYSKVVTQAGVARFECVRSASGMCHYNLFPRDCAPAAGAGTTPGKDCLSTPIESFAIANGDRRLIPGLQPFRVCVSAQDGTTAQDCKVPEPMEAW